MRYNLLTLLILLPFVTSSQIGHIRCYGDYPVYYSKTQVHIYQEWNADSAIKKSIPKGEKVHVVSSTLGKTFGFWEVCYKGTTGYVKKSQLSRDKVPSEEANRKQSLSDFEQMVRQAQQEAVDKANQDIVVDGKVYKKIPDQQKGLQVPKSNVPYGGGILDKATVERRNKLVTERKRDENIRNILFVIIPIILIALVGAFIYKVLK